MYIHLSKFCNKQVKTSSIFMFSAIPLRQISLWLRLYDHNRMMVAMEKHVELCKVKEEKSL